MLKISLEGYPVGIKELEPQDLKSLQDYYLPLILNDGNTVSSNSASKISKNLSQRYDSDFFKKWNEVLLPGPYIQDYIDSFMFKFPYDIDIETWYNVHEQYDHQQLHNHITTNVPAFSCVVILKQPSPEAGQFVFRTPSLSNHLKYLELDPMNQFPNTFEPEMKEGLILIFPSCLEHYVYLNQTTEPRVVFSSNITLKRKGDLF
tara:strand:+ start:27 stop:638 length:612 start_codon:yes stop_codon:yes gene_type:complete